MKKMKLRKLNLGLASKKGNIVLDITVVVVVLVALAITAIFTYSVFDDINTDVQNDPDLSADAKEDVNNLHTQFPGILDGGFITIMVFLWIAVILSVFALDAHPVFFIFAVLLLAFVIFVGAVLSNTYEEITEDDEFLTFADAFPMSNFIIGQLPYIIVAMGASVMLALYAKNSI